MKKNESRSDIVYKNTTIVAMTHILQILVGFWIRKVFIDTLGIEFLGYNSVFSNILSMLNVADLGIAVAITSFLYQPLAERNEERVATLMYIYKKIYQVIGALVSVFGIIISFFLQILIPDAGISYKFLLVLYYINLVGVVSTYYLAYNRTLIIANQQTYITALVDTFLFFLISALQAIALIFFTNYILYLVLNISKNIIANIVLTIKVRKEYPYLTDKVNKSYLSEYKFRIVQYVKDLFISKIGAYVFYSTDNVIISIIKGSLLTGFLANYTLVTSQVQTLVTQMLSSIQATLGQYLNTEKDKEKQKRVIDGYLFANFLLGSFCCLCISFLIQPFIGLIFGQEYTLYKTTSILLGINLMLTILIQLPAQIFVVYKLYKYDKPIICVSATLNIVVSAILVKFCGIDGALIGTTFTSLIYLYSRLHVIASKVYGESSKRYVLSLNKYYVCMLITYFLIYRSISLVSINSQWGEFITIAVITGFESIIAPVALLSKNREFEFLLKKFTPKKITNKISLEKIQNCFNIIRIFVIVIVLLLFAQIVYSTGRDVYSYIEIKALQNEQMQVDDQNQPYFHFSVDDTIMLFQDLTQKQMIYNSIFDNQTLHFIKKIHDKYGLVVTFYCYYKNDNFDLSQATSNFAEEFKENSDWLKFGFHAWDSKTTYQNLSSEEAAHEYTLVIDELERICGGKESIDRTVRLSRYEGSENVIKALSNLETGLTGLYTADDNRDSYFLSTNEESIVRKNGCAFIENMNFIQTDVRLEHITDIKQEYEKLGQDKQFIVFTHEYYMADQDIQKRLATLCDYAVRKNYVFRFTS